jgi:hypothetical protein
MEEALRRLPRSWTGTYNNDYKFQLTVQDWAEQPLQGAISYLGTRTVTRATGALVENASEIAAVLGLSSSLSRDPDETQIAVVFLETGYEERGDRRPIDFNGEYRVVVSERSMVGGWFRLGGLVAGFELKADES